MAPAVGVEMDYSIDLSARVGSPASDAALGDWLLSALETAAPDAAVAQDAAAGTIDARCRQKGKSRAPSAIAASRLSQ